MNKISVLILVLMTGLLSSCAMLSDEPEAAEEKQKAQVQEPVPAKVETPVTEPAPVETVVEPPIKAEQRIDIAANETPARAFFMSLVEGTNVNMVVHPDVAGEITIQLKDVTLHEALRAVRDVYGYDFAVKPYGFQIVPRKLQNKLFHINYLNINRIGISATSVSSGQITSSQENSESGNQSSSTSSVSTVQSTQIQTESHSNFWQKLQNQLSMVIGEGDGRQVIVDSDAGIALVRAFPQELRAVDEYLESAQLNLQRQVIIEAKILEVNLGEGYQAGIQWDTFGLGYNGSLTASTEKLAASLESKTTNELVDQTVEGMFTVGANYSNFTAIISLLESSGDVQVLSSPRVATVNNQKAVIKVGTDEFFVTEISSNTTNTATSTTDSPEVTLTPFFSGIALDVTPHISEDNEVILHVHPTITEVIEKVKNVGIGSDVLSLPLAFSSIREADSVVKAQTGQVVVIGGLMQNKTNHKTAGIPYLSRIPFLGKLFMNEKEITTKSELVILLKPKVVGGDDWKDDYEVLKERFPELNEES